MRQNLARRAALVDAAIEVLAREGARGLTFRAVDTEARVPNGTASNYFASRDDLLTQAGGRIYERMRPDDATMAAMAAGPATRERVVELVREVVGRVAAFRTGYLALLELRLEATRRPALRAVLTERVRTDVEANVRHHLDAGLPGDADAVKMIYLATNWLVVEQLTLPGVFPAEEAGALIGALVERLLPPA
ncbi:TetR family transcriptional regulator [Streptomyces scopuliridis]|uniref:TetR family transcriptional regulator n=2 Tax=Streptomyces scopuliridis TaxID=452529 RepID=A0A2T7SRF6_9ACTN|nr:TetR/AcrR family transcriptional regulator [Streptomyces scopuliridis]PVE05456.1 TetR family transcriptional regulator [Streptomyces scopuliridis RB72]WSB35271.1 TetR family transcriptional regulator [Streptomyces scopuliridis]WSB99514.1 TetR family transcriptional regulator [Streptomyces scopuliridis]WSC06786.1 TetR family transcriptional regulator [Streptomyces scopuliridis]